MANHGKYNVRPITQRGYAMLGIIAAVGIATTAVVVTSLSATAVRNEQSRKDSNALAVAKQALIASAASSNTRPGSLPCPDIDNDGISDVQNISVVDSPCAARIGRLPWQTLGLADLRDASGERLWYAISLNFQDTSANQINASANGQLTLTDNTQTTTGVVAIVLAPGKPVSNQSRDVTRVNNYEHYLESYAAGQLTVNVAGQDAAHNDQILAITPADIFSLVQRRVIKEAQLSLQNYYANASTLNTLPYPATVENFDGNTTYSYPMTPTNSVVPSYSGYLPSESNQALPAWFAANRWNRVLQYTVDSNCVQSGNPAQCGSASFSVQSGSTVVGSSPTSGTMAMLAFPGVNTAYSNAATTVISASVQAQSPSVQTP